MATKPVLLSGDNPQIAKAYGDAPVQAYVDAVPGWKHAVVKRVDALIDATVPGVQKAVKYNSPFYGMERDSWFCSVHCYAKWVRVTFFRGQKLDPVPPGPSNVADTRYLDIREGAFDEAQFVAWIRQASALPGERV
jgi:hypothetical protein